MLTKHVGLWPERAMSQPNPAVFHIGHKPCKFLGTKYSQACSVAKYGCLRLHAVLRSNEHD